MKFLTAKLAKILLFIFILVLSFTFLTQTVPEMEYMEQTVDFIEESQNTLMTFSGTTTATSLAISALPDEQAPYPT